MKTSMRNAFALAATVIATQAAAQVTFYEHDRFAGQSFSIDEQVRNLQRFGFNDRASSAVVFGSQWEVCEDARFNGRCVVLRPGRYPSLGAMGLNDRISSVRKVAESADIEPDRYAPMPAESQDYRRQRSERLYQVDVSSVRAVVDTPERRCWVEQEQVTAERAGYNVPVALAGALIGGILGHQVGGGRGQDIATAGGAVAGAALGANYGRGSDGGVTTKDVQRCSETPSQRPNHWDVGYRFRGEEHQVQMTEAPGRTITVNEQCEPRQ
jgi:uncharacterized protein YcfJ